MKTKSSLLLFALTTLSLFPFPLIGNECVESPNLLWQVGFEETSEGILTYQELQQAWPNVDWWEGLERAIIESDPSNLHHKVLKVKYPQGAVGPRVGGAQFVVPLPPRDQYTLAYDFCLSEDFDYQLGGKLPGLTSGGANYTGGHKPEQGQGWSARFMWRTEGRMVLYLYSMDMKGKWGDDFPLDLPPLQKGRWYSVEQRITLNTDSQHNGCIEVWVDGKKTLDLNNLRLRLEDRGKIDSFYFSTFFGGNTPEWGPENDCSIKFDNFQVGFSANYTN